jgi:hypothetical protein
MSLAGSRRGRPSRWRLPCYLTPEALTDDVESVEIDDRWPLDAEDITPMRILTAIHDHPIRRHLDAILTFLFGGAGTLAWLGLGLQLVCAVAAGISGYVTLRRFGWEAQDRNERRVHERAAELERDHPAAPRPECPAPIDTSTTRS